MPSFGHRHLLRLRGLPKMAPSRLPSRAVSTGFMDMDMSSSYLPPYLLRPSNIASSSRLTLDAFLNTGSEEDRIASALSFAAEDELLAAALAPIPTSKATSQWVDPAAAYLGLRSSGLFSHYLQLLLPRIRTLYANLRPSGMHQLLVSDLLLRNPDARALREILQEEADPVHPHTNSDNLRAGLVLQVYRTIAPSIRRHVIPRLSRRALLSVTRSLRMQTKDESPEVLSDLFYDVALTTNWEPEGTWPLLEIVLRLARTGHAKQALRLLQYPLQLSKLPHDALGRTPPSHERAAELMVQSTVVRTLLTWGFTERAMRAVDDLVNTMMESSPSDAAMELVLVACRVAVLSRNEGAAAWAQDTLLRLANDSRFPPLSSATINFQLDASDNQALKFYELLPERHAPPSPSNIRRLALSKPTRGLSRRLAIDLSRTPQDASAAIPGILRAFASARMLLLVRAAYSAWNAGLANLDSNTTLVLVHAFTRGSRSAKNTEFAQAVLNDYLSTTGKQVSAVDATLTALHAYGLIGHSKSDGVDPAAEHVEVLIRTLGHSGALERLQTLVAQNPLLAHRLAQVGRAHGLDLPTAGVTIASACAARHWGALSACASLELKADEAAYLGVLGAARKSRRTATLKRFRSAVTAFPASPMVVPTAAAILHRFAALHAWTEGLEVLLLVTGNNVDVSEAASVFLSSLQREASGAVANDAADAAREAAQRVAQDTQAAAASLGLIEIYIDNVDGRPDAPAARAHEALVAATAAGTASEGRDAAREAWARFGPRVTASAARMEPLGWTLVEAMCAGVDASVVVPEGTARV